MPAHRRERRRAPMGTPLRTNGSVAAHQRERYSLLGEIRACQTKILISCAIHTPTTPKKCFNNPIKFTIMNLYCKINKSTTLNGKGAQKMFPKLITYSTIDTDELVDMLHRNCGVNPGDTLKVVAGMGQVMAEMLSNGHRIHVRGLGTFALSLKGNIKEKDDGTKALDNVYINKVVYTPDKRLMRDLCAAKVGLATQTVFASHTLNQDTALNAANAVLKRDGVILTETFAGEANVSLTYARRWLTRLTDNGLLVRQGSRNRYLYRSC